MPHPSIRSLISPLILPSQNLQLPARRSLTSPLTLPSQNLQIPARVSLIVKCGEWNPDIRTGSRFSGGAVANMILKQYSGTEILAYVSQVNKVALPEDLIDDYAVTCDQIESNTLRCPNLEYAKEMTDAIAVRGGDSVGGAITCIVRNIPRITHGPESSLFALLHENLVKAVLSIPATRRVKFVSFLEDVLMIDSEDDVETNGSGAIQGGITSGEFIKMRIDLSPTATISMGIMAQGRSYPCFLPLAVPLVEAAVALEIGKLLMAQLSSPK